MRRNTIHIILFILTVISTWMTGGPSYSIAIILILLGHEMGHYFMSRKHGMRATLPFFLPFPLSPFGTLGAVIRMEGSLSSRKAIFDTGVAGPLTSLILSIPAIAVGLNLSLLQAFTVLGGLVVGVMIPAGPGMVGTFQAATVLGVSLFVPKEVLDTRGTAYANVLWAVQLAFTAALGLFFLFSRHIRKAQIFSAPSEVEEGLEAEEKEYVAKGDGAPPTGGAAR